MKSPCLCLFFVLTTWQMSGFAQEGMRTGERLVDDIQPAKIGEQITIPKPRLRIPATLNLTVFGKPLSAVVGAYRDGDETIRRAVEGRIQEAERWAAKDDAWYVERTGKHTPLGMWTLACPFHPERVRDFSEDNFEWDIENPWRSPTAW